MTRRVGAALVLVLLALVTPPARAAARGDNQIEDAALGHNSRDTMYRMPSGAVPAGTEVRLRLRARASDVTLVTLRLVDVGSQVTTEIPMSLAASDITCFDAELDARGGCDYWDGSFLAGHLGTLSYRFIVADGVVSKEYGDNGQGELSGNGGWGTATWTPEVFQIPCCVNGYAITVYRPDFAPVPWMQDAVVYQIFPDRFFNGDPSNDPTGDEPRYGYPERGTGDRIINRAWGELPEGSCRSWQSTPCNESILGRDYFGGDLEGIRQKLEYLQALGVTVLYLNPIFDASSNHAYDTQDLTKIEPFFGSREDFRELSEAAAARGIRVILDLQAHSVGSDSRYFDLYHHSGDDGACETARSPYRSWFTFRHGAFGECADDLGLPTQTYENWFGFGQLPRLRSELPELRDLLFRNEGSVAKSWARDGSAGYRLDSMNSLSPSFWREFREHMKTSDPDMAIIGELWHRIWVMPWIHGDTVDGVMNYRFRNAVEALLAGKETEGFQTGGLGSPSAFASKIEVMREDYPDAVWFGSWNLLDSHDTQRMLWELTPGPNNRAAKEFDPGNVAVGKARMRLATLLQMTMPGAPTIYYGDEVALTGGDDPDDRRTFPWNGSGVDGAGGDQDLFDYVSDLTALRKDVSSLRRGDLTFLLADDEAKTMAYSRTDPSGISIVVSNSGETEQSITVPLGGLRDGISFTDALTGARYTSAGGAISVGLPPLSGVLLVSDSGQDLVGPPPPSVESERLGATVALSWQPSGDAVSYRIYRSPLDGGGYRLLGTTTGTTFFDRSHRKAHYLVRAVDAAGNEGPESADMAR